jgi:ABC-2 type transport system ATP-binding protein
VSYVQLTDVSVRIPVYDVSARSLKKALVRLGTGARIANNAGIVEVEALNGINLSIGPGDRIGLLGHNGSGKTTLLRVISGIYAPTSGHQEIRGRVLALFDMAAGMDPDCTGRENIRLRGHYLGLSNRTIDESMGEIADFAGLGDFIDLPVRTYSAGMMARLAFAITTAARADVLAVDEGIGAGDAAFIDQAKARLQSFLDSAGALVLATHSEEILRRLCNRVVVLQQGRIMVDSDVDSAIEAYQKMVAGYRKQ